MRREFVPFDEQTIQKELDELPAKDADKLVALISHYEVCGNENPMPVQVDSYGDGIYRLRHMKPAYQGRMLFFTSERTRDFERLVILAVYKKEGQRTPTIILDTAKRRKAQWEQRGKNQ